MPIPTNRPPVPALVAIRSGEAPRFPFERPLPLVPSRTANLPSAPGMATFRSIPLGHAQDAYGATPTRDHRSQAVERAEAENASVATVGLFALACCVSVLAALAFL